MTPATVDTSNPIAARLSAAKAQGLAPRAVHAENTDGGRTWHVKVTFKNFVPLGEGSPEIGRYTVTTPKPDELPPGVTMQGRERWPDECFTVTAPEEHLEAWFHAIREYDVARFATPGRVAYLTKF